MKQLSIRAAAAVLALALVACGSSDSQRLENISALDGDSTAGQALYEANCSSCHGGDGASGSVGENITGAGSASTIGIILSGDGSMPSFADDLTDQEIADVNAYVQTL